MTRPAQKMRRQKARRPWEEDGGCHSQQTCRRIRNVHHHKQECQSHLMRRRHWFIGIFSSGISSATRLPRLFSPAMEDDWIYEGEIVKLLQDFGRRRRAKEQLRMEMCSKPKPSAGIWRHEEKRRTHWGAQKATTINRRRSATSLMSMRIRHWATKGRKSKGSLNKSRVFILNWIKIGRMESTIFKSAL